MRTPRHVGQSVLRQATLGTAPLSTPSPGTLCTLGRRLKALMLSAIALSVASVGAANPVPPVLDKFLASNPALHLLQLAEVRDIVDPAVEEFSPFVQVDLTGDRIVDVVAVVVQPGSPKRYGVVAFNGSRAGFGGRRWIVRLQPERIVGLYVRERQRIDIAYCVECDSNPFARWDGTEYVENLWVPGDSPATFDRASKGVTPVGLRGSPIETGRVIAKLPECTAVEVLGSVKRSTGERWYRVAVVVNGERQVGFIRQRDVTEVSCIG
jgi:hypothetical protein